METRDSELDKTYKIDANKWVLTMARKPVGAHPQHAFLILEGVKGGKAVIWFMDPIGPGMSDKLPNIKKSHIRIKDFSAASSVELDRSPLLYRCSDLRTDGSGKKIAEMMDLKQGDSIARQTWSINPEDGETLIRNIEKDQQNPPLFSIFGEKSILAGSSACSSSTNRGHNCFTYAKEKINQLNNTDIQIRCDASAYCIERIIGITSLTLKTGKELNSYCPYFSNKALTLTGLGALF